jgi:hypothetical protein
MPTWRRIPYRKVGWALFLTPIAGCVGALPLIAPLHASGPFLVFALLGALTFGSMFAAPVTLIVLPVVRCLLPGRNGFSLFVLALSGLVFGFLSPAAITFLWQKSSSFVRMESVLALGALGAGSGLIMAFVWFYLTRPPLGEDSVPLDWRSAMRKLTNVPEVVAYIVAHALGMAFSLLGGTVAVITIARSYGAQNIMAVSLIYSVVVMLVVMALFFVLRALLSNNTNVSSQ